MKITYRLATVKDTKQLASWWRDGEVMAHAGFPLGLTIDETKLQDRLLNQKESNHQVFIIEYDAQSIGELGVKIEGNEAEIGIKICEVSYQNKGLGTTILSKLIADLFLTRNITRIKLDTMLENTRAQKVYERLGFIKVGVDYDVFIDQLGNKRSAILYQLSKEDYLKR